MTVLIVLVFVASVVWFAGALTNHVLNAWDKHFALHIEYIDKPISTSAFQPQLRFQSVSSAAVDYESMSVRELRALCSADPARFKGYSTVLKRGGKLGLVEWMSTR